MNKTIKILLIAITMLPMFGYSAITKFGDIVVSNLTVSGSASIPGYVPTTNAFPLQSGVNVSNRLAVAETNTAPLQSFLSISNTVKVLQTNTAPLQSYLATSNTVKVLQTNTAPLQ